MLVGSTNGNSGQSREELTKTKAKELWQEMRQGSKAAFELLFRSYYADLYDFGIKMGHSNEMVRDTLQELFLYIWQKKKNLSGVQSVRSYLLTSMRHKLFNSLKNQNSLREKKEKWQEEQPSFAFSFEDKYIDFETEQEKRELIARAMRSVPERERETLYLKTYQNCSYREISQIMQISEQAARNYVCGALKKLRLHILKHTSLIKNESDH